jgi:pilus assembly protein Flp/PilA
MNAFRKRLGRLLRDEAGPTSVEYAVMLALILAVAISAIQALGGGVEGRWQQNASLIINATQSGG